MSSSRRAVVTGGSRGIGRSVAMALAELGWRVTLVARERQSLEQVVAELPGSEHVIMSMDVTDEDSWRRLAQTFEDVEGLVCAAAMLDPIGPVGHYSAESFRRTLDVNVTGTLLALESCLPSLLARRGRVVTFSGGGATAPLPRFDAYAASKAAVVRLTENWALALKDTGVRVNAVAPGFVATDLHKSTLAAGPELVGSGYFDRTLRDLEAGGTPASEAAELVCKLLDPDVAVSGRLLSAQWDPWRDPDFWRALEENSDLGTLRRIDNMLFGSVSERP